MWATWIQSLGWKDPLEEGMTTQSSILAWRIPMDRGAWRATVHGVAKSQTQLSMSHFWCVLEFCFCGIILIRKVNIFLHFVYLVYTFLFITVYSCFLTPGPPVKSQVYIRVSRFFVQGECCRLSQMESVTLSSS